ncbi:GNAT family N-acetyltransferase [Leptolyngbya sp. FACHB-321]|uniref:GNAT family N-acetyltransferase n=1 Tax=Leptolyngbya sp. FACHB-321 TaxID=2692807 RepID=UPI001682F454|nr:GNAT family N-acetyltransferase [Leptolyngbya sp. FACHB-321]MBD2034480.1 GNAT family N-acetyltransferase [Leptolyngbya sp. FACHB-321]
MLPLITLETPRLVLRPLALTDAPAIQRLASDRAVANTMISIPHPYPEGEAENYLSTRISEFQEQHSVAFAIERKPEKSVSGVIEIREIDREHSLAELSFWLGVEAWGRGYMSEALLSVLCFSFNDLHLNRLYAHHMLRNPASGRVLKKNGFVQEGVLRQRVQKWGVFEDVVLLAILYKDWKRNVAP